MMAANEWMIPGPYSRAEVDGTRKRDATEPLEPQRWHFRIPPFYTTFHPYTKWMLNMIRGNAIHRLATMVKERPQLFRQYFQFADSPEVLTKDDTDHLCMFHKRCVLYLTPLCLAIYLKRDKAVDLLMKSGLNNPYQSCFATDVFASKHPDILEICAACVALKREFFQAIPLLCQGSGDYNVLSEEQPTLKIDEPISLRYATNDSRRFFRYQDLLHYGIEILQRNPNFPLNRLIECLIIDCAEFYNAVSLSEDLKGEKVSLFRRLTRLAYYDDIHCRVSLQLIACFETLLRNLCFPWKGRMSGKTCEEDPDFILKYLKSRNQLSKDLDATLLLLSGLYHRLRTKSRGLSRLDHLGQLIHKILSLIHWLPVFLSVTLEDLQLISRDINESIPLTKQTLMAIQQHIKAIDEVEKTREVIIRDDVPARRERFHSHHLNCTHNMAASQVLMGSWDANPTWLQQDIIPEPRMHTVRQITRVRRSEPMGQPKIEKQSLLTYHHDRMGTASKRHARSRSEPHRRLTARGEGFANFNAHSEEDLLDLNYGHHPGALGDRKDDDSEEELNEWRFERSQQNARHHSPSPLPKRKPITGIPPPMLRRSYPSVSLRRNSLSPESPWKMQPPQLQHASVGNTTQMSTIRPKPPAGRHMRQMSIEAYENQVLDAMFDDFECDSSSQGDFIMPRVKHKQKRGHFAAE